jgi:hypothetical protein
VALCKATAGSWKDIFEASALKPILISVTLILLQQFSGIFPVTVYTVDIFRSAGTSIDENLSVNLIGVIQVVRESVYWIVIVLYCIEKVYCSTYRKYWYHAKKDFRFSAAYEIIRIHILPFRMDNFLILIPHLHCTTT